MSATTCASLYLIAITTKLYQFLLYEMPCIDSWFVRMQVRAHVVATWAKHLAAVYKDLHPELNLSVNTGQLAVFEDADAVLDALAHNAIFTHNSEDATHMHQQFMAMRTGPSTGRWQSCEEHAMHNAGESCLCATRCVSCMLCTPMLIVQLRSCRPARIALVIS